MKDYFWVLTSLTLWLYSSSWVSASAQVGFTAASPPRVSRSEYEQVQLGMTVEEVSRLIGRGIALERSWREASIGTNTYQWERSDGIEQNGQLVQIVFHNGRVVARSAWCPSVMTLCTQ